MSSAAVRGLLERHGLAARRDLGQNFLTDEGLAARLAVVAGVSARDTAIEIGAGLGILTRALAARAARVVAIEIDAGLVRALRAEPGLPDNVRLIHADALDVDLEALVAAAPGPVRAVGNLPYSAASPVLRRLLELRERLVGWSVMVQREVADRVLAAPGSRDYGSLAVLHRLTVRARRELELSPSCFYPVPRVRSCFVTFEPRRDGSLGNRELEGVERLARAAFAHRRKLLVNSLRDAGFEASSDAVREELRALDLGPRARAEQLTPEQFRELAGRLS